MSYVIYNIETTKLLLLKFNSPRTYATISAAKSAITRASREIPHVTNLIKKADYAIAESEHFHKFIEKTEVRHGIGPSAGKKFVVPVNTPWISGPWSETYWSS